MTGTGHNNLLCPLVTIRAPDHGMIAVIAATLMTTAEIHQRC